MQKWDGVQILCTNICERHKSFSKYVEMQVLDNLSSLILMYGLEMYLSLRKITWTILIEIDPELIILKCYNLIFALKGMPSYFTG